MLLLCPTTFTPLHLDVDDDAIRRVRATLLDILQCACFV
jgi:hypothetical protein